MPVISVRNLVKTYTVGEVVVRALRGADLDVDPGEFVAVTGPVGLRQVDVDAHPRLPRSADQRAVHPRRQGRLADVEGRARAGAQPENRLRLPGLQPAVAHDRARQRRAAAPLQRRREDEDGRTSQARDGGAHRRRSRRAVPSLSEPAVGRPAAARRDRARADQRAVDHPRRRADRATSIRAPASRSWASSSA